MKQNTQFAVLGLGRFGLSIVHTLAEYDVNILVCDHNADRLQLATGAATHLVQGDISDEHVLQSLGLGNFDVVVICTAEQFEASVIAAMVAKEVGAGQVIVKAKGLRQKRILESIGVDSVVLPELEMGAKTAHRLVGHDMTDLFDGPAQNIFSQMKPLGNWVGQSIREADVRNEHKLTIIGILRDGELQAPVSPEETIQKDDILITMGRPEE